jgi:hypothetical protein
MKPREKKVYKSLPQREGFVWAVVVEEFDGNRIGQTIELCDRRFKTLSNRNKVRRYEN